MCAVRASNARRRVPLRWQAGCFSLTVERKPFHAHGLAAHIEDVVVDDSRRGTGLGRALLAAASALAEQLGCCSVSLNVRRARIPCITQPARSRSTIAGGASVVMRDAAS